MPDKQLVQRVLEMIRDAHLEMPERSDLRGFARGHPAKPFADAKDVRVDSEAGTLQTEENHAGGSFGADTGVFG